MDTLLAGAYRRGHGHLYHRSAPGIELPEDAEGRARGFALLHQLTREQALTDIAAGVDYLHAAGAARRIEIQGRRNANAVASARLARPSLARIFDTWCSTVRRVVLSDVTTEMTAIESARARALGLATVNARELDLEHIEQPEGSSSVVLCRDGLQFVLDPGRAVREMRRVLRPGGRVALAVWGSALHDTDRAGVPRCRAARRNTPRLADPCLLTKPIPPLVRHDPLRQPGQEPNLANPPTGRREARLDMTAHAQIGPV